MRSLANLSARRILRSSSEFSATVCDWYKFSVSHQPSDVSAILSSFFLSFRISRAALSSVLVRVLSCKSTEEIPNFIVKAAQSRTEYCF